MTAPLFSSSGTASYHEDKLIVKTRPSIQRFSPAIARATASASPSTILLGSPGLSTLSVMERAGMIKRVIPLSREVERRSLSSGRGALAALAFRENEDQDADPNAGVSLVELENSADSSNLENLQATLANDPEIEFVSRVPIRRLLIQPNTRPGRRRGEIAAAPPAASTMWNLSRIRWQEARGRNGFREAEDIKVAVLDTGIQPDHPDLEGRVAKYVFQHPAIPSASSDRDIIGHGTHVAGTIGAVTGNNLGINGICHCQIYAWKIFDDKPDYDRFDDEFVYYVDTVMYHRALADCLTEGVNLINLSIGGQGRPDLNEQRLFNRLLSQEVTIVASMGNEGLIGSPISYPAAIPGVVAVGAIRADDRRANFSNYGNHISICAPGVSIWSTLPTYPGQSGFEAVLSNGGRRIPGRAIERETDYDAWSGTSMASPHVAAASALLMANKGRMSPADIKVRLEQTTDKVVHMNGDAFTPEYGFGRLNLLNLLS